jgi:Tol biopolymer transport system component
MRQRTGAVLAMLMACAGIITTAQQPSARMMLEAARKAEVIDGDLARAIEQYKAVADRYAADRAVAAEALVRLAAAYQKLGDAQATAVYERVIRDYADQKEAVATARARITRVPSATAPSTVGDRVVWSGLDVDLFGTVSPDGRFLSYTDWRTTNNTLVRDLATGAMRAITSNTTFGEHGYSGWSAISHDGRQIAFEWIPLGPGVQARQPPGGRTELRVADLSGSGTPVSRLVRQFDAGESVRAFDWSPDGSWIAVLVERRGDWSQIGVVSPADGSLKLLKSVDWRSVTKMTFSPDGKYVAYDLATSDSGLEAQVLVMAVDGSEEHVVVDDSADNHVMGWARDGQLVFASRRSGALSLWAVPVAGGRAVGPARLVKENIGSSWSLGMAASGTLFTWKRASAPYVRVAPIDFASGRLGEPDRQGFQQFVDSRGRPAWSGDGRHLFFESCGPGGGGPCTLFDRSTETGVVRQVPHQLRYLGFPRPSHDGRWIVTDGADNKGRQGLYLVDTLTGATTVVARGDSRPRYPGWARGGAFYFTETRNAHDVVIQRAPASERETELLRIPLADSGLALRLAPDGRTVAYVRDDRPGKRSHLVVRRVDGGETRVLLNAPIGSISFHWEWLPSGDALLVHQILQGDVSELWLVPTAGAPRKLEVETRQWPEGGVFAVHPDGRQIAFVSASGEPGADVWALENFLRRQRTASVR